MGKGLHKVFKTVIKYILQDLPPLGESGSEVSHFITEPRNFAEVTKYSYDIKKPWLKATLKEIKNLINNHNLSLKIRRKMSLWLHAWIFTKLRYNVMEF